MPNKTPVQILLLVWLCTWAKLLAGIPVLRPLQARMQSAKIWAFGCCKPHSPSETLSDSQWSSSADFLSHPYKVRPSGVLSIWHCASLGAGPFCQSVATPLYLSNKVLLCLLPRGCVSLILGLWDFQNGCLSISSCALVFL